MYNVDFISISILKKLQTFSINIIAFLVENFVNNWKLNVEKQTIKLAKFVVSLI
jgi:hypothetical protein